VLEHLVSVQITSEKVMTQTAVVRKAAGSIGIALVLAGIVAGRNGAVAAQRPADSGSSEVEVLQVRPDFYMIAGAGGNVGVQTGPDGTVLCDSGNTDRADDVIAAVRRVTTTPIRFIINTGAEPEHVGGNVKVSQAGKTIYQIGGAGPPGANLGAAMTNNGAATVLAHEGVLFRMSAPTGQVSPFPAEAWPTETFESERKYIYMNREAIEMLHQPHAHADGDSFVMFRRSDIVCAGDILDTTAFPRIDVQHGGSVQGEIDALNRLVQMAVPSVPLVYQEGGTLVIPGHGRLFDQTDIAEYRDMVTIMRDRVRAMITAKMTLAQVQAANVAQGYAGRYGRTPSATSTFIESVYTSLTSGATKNASAQQASTQSSQSNKKSQPTKK
jgi:glyoxylase-like metal-dependent hydrolase (beta-lactamase superfamily II)